MKQVLLIFIGVTTLMIFSPSGVFGFDFENLMKDLGVLHRTDKEHFERGIKFGKKLLWHREMDSYKKAISINPNYAEAHFNLGMVLLMIKTGEDGQDAMPSFKEAIRINPDYAEAHYQLGSIYRNFAFWHEGAKESLDDAIASFKETIRINPDHAKAHYELGIIYDRLNRYDDGLASLEKHTRIKPNDISSQLVLARLYKNTKDYEKAIFYAAKVKNLYEKQGNKVEANRASRDLELYTHVPNAIASYKERIRLKPHDAEAHYNYYSELHYNLGMNYFKLDFGHHNDAIFSFKEAIRINPGYSAAHKDLGATYSKQILNKCRWRIRGKCKPLPGDYDVAIDSFLRAIGINPDDAEAHYGLGIIYDRLNRYDDSIASFKEAIRVNPDYTEAHYKLGSIYSILKRYDDAIAPYKEVIRIKPNDAVAHSDLGDMYSKLERYDDAIAPYKEVVRIKPKDAEAKIILGETFDKVGDGEMAIFYMIKAKEKYLLDGKSFLWGLPYRQGLLDKYLAKYGGKHRILPVDYAEPDIKSRALWFEFEHDLSSWSCEENFASTSKFITMRSGNFLYNININVAKLNPLAHEFLGIEVDPKSALVAYSGVNGFSFSEKLTFELKQNVENIIIKYTGETKKIKRCKIQLAGILKKKLSERQEYEQARANVIRSIRQPENIVPPVTPIKPRTPPPPVFQVPLAQAPSQKAPKAVKRLYAGTGFMFGSKDYVITNWHVIRGTKKIKVRFLNGEKINAEVLLKDPQNDIAFLKLERPPQLPQSDLKVGDSSKVRMGDRVFTIGYPAHWVMGQNPKYTEGVVNALSGIKDDPTVFQISVQIQPGNSGGPLFNQNGNIIGITQAALDPQLATESIGALPQNVNYAVKSSYISALLPMLPETLIASRGIVIVPKEPENTLANFIEKAKKNIVLIEATE